MNLCQNLLLCKNRENFNSAYELYAFNMEIRNKGIINKFYIFVRLSTFNPL